MNIGKALRLRSLFRYSDSHTVLVPMDHGITLGPIRGITDIEQTIRVLSKLPVDGIILHKGIITSCHEAIIKSNLSLIMHLSASTTLGDRSTKILVGGVMEALSFGCDGVSIHMNFGEPNEGVMLRDAAMVSEECYKFGMPLLIMAYHKNSDIGTISHIARVSAELGADLVKVSYPNDGGDFTKVVSGCPIPIVVAGGEADGKIIDTISRAISSGAKGAAIGRNIFQSDQIADTIEKIIKVVRPNK